MIFCHYTTFKADRLGCVHTVSIDRLKVKYSNDSLLPDISRTVADITRLSDHITCHLTVCTYSCLPRPQMETPSHVQNISHLALVQLPMRLSSHFQSSIRLTLLSVRMISAPPVQSNNALIRSRSSEGGVSTMFLRLSQTQSLSHTRY